MQTSKNKATCNNTARQSLRTLKKFIYSQTASKTIETDESETTESHKSANQNGGGVDVGEDAQPPEKVSQILFPEDLDISLESEPQTTAVSPAEEGAEGEKDDENTHKTPTKSTGSKTTGTTRPSTSTVMSPGSVFDDETDEHFRATHTQTTGGKWNCEAIAQFFTEFFNNLLTSAVICDLACVSVFLGLPISSNVRLYQIYLSSSSSFFLFFIFKNFFFTFYFVFFFFRLFDKG